MASPLLFRTVRNPPKRALSQPCSKGLMRIKNTVLKTGIEASGSKRKGGTRFLLAGMLTGTFFFPALYTAKTHKSKAEPYRHEEEEEEEEVPAAAGLVWLTEGRVCGSAETPFPGTVGSPSARNGEPLSWP